MSVVPFKSTIVSEPNLQTWIFSIGATGYLTGSFAEETSLLKATSLHMTAQGHGKGDQFPLLGFATVNGKTYLAAHCTLSFANTIHQRLFQSCSGFEKTDAPIHQNKPAPLTFRKAL